jgi:hypothetical protein
VLLDLLDLVFTGSKREKEFRSKRKCACVIALAWERTKRVLATRFYMHFAARRAVVDDAPRGMVDIEAPFPVAVAEQQ